MRHHIGKASKSATGEGDVSMKYMTQMLGVNTQHDNAISEEEIPIQHDDATSEEENPKKKKNAANVHTLKFANI